MQIYEVTDPLFKEYGKIIDSVELTELLAEMKHTPVPEFSPMLPKTMVQMLTAVPRSWGMRSRRR